MIKKYTKKPVVIEAVKFVYNKDCIEFLQDWMGDAFLEVYKERHINSVGWLHVGTLEDGNGQTTHIAIEGDYIIKGIHGEFYPCKPDIFAKTYDENPL